MEAFLWERVMRGRDPPTHLVLVGGQGQGGEAGGLMGRDVVKDRVQL